MFQLFAVALVDPTMAEYITAATGAFTAIIPATTILVLGGAGLMLALSAKFGRRILAMFR